jgi:hypothetical protein
VALSLVRSHGVDQTFPHQLTITNRAMTLFYIFGDFSRLQGPDISPHISSVNL